jgi:hypothetical protein
MNRRVDRAMDLDRPAKQTMRRIWAEIIEQYAAVHVIDAEAPLYLTLSGAQGRDIEVLIQRGVIARTESGAIRAEDAAKVVAVESSSAAVLELQRRFPGLKIVEAPIQSLIRGDGQLRWPDGEHEDYCRARVINLDLNAVLDARNEDGEVVFPIISWASKFAQLHARNPRLDWTLCLTLHGEIHWPAAVNQVVVQFLAENFAREPLFAAACQEFLGDALHARIANRENIDFSRLSRDAGIRILMAFVPKKIIQLSHQQGWRIATNRNLRYGGEADQAPIVAWELIFSRDARGGNRPDELYRECISQILSRHGQIAKDGTLL